MRHKGVIGSALVKGTGQICKEAVQNKVEWMQKECTWPQISKVLKGILSMCMVISSFSANLCAEDTQPCFTVQMLQGVKMIWREHCEVWQSTCLTFIFVFICFPWEGATTTLRLMENCTKYSSTKPQHYWKLLRNLCKPIHCMQLNMWYKKESLWEELVHKFLHPTKIGMYIHK